MLDDETYPNKAESEEKVTHFDHRQAIDHISFDAGGVIVFLDDVRMAKELSEFSGRKVTSAECMRAERYVMCKASGMFRTQETNGIPGWAHDFFGDLATQILKADATRHPRFHEFLVRFYTMNVEQMLYSKIGLDVVVALARLKDHGFRLSVTSDASGQVERHFKEQGLYQYFEFILDSGIEGHEQAGTLRHADKMRRRTGQTHPARGQQRKAGGREAVRTGLQAVFFDPQDVCLSPPDGIPRFRSLLDMADMLMGRTS